MSVSALLLTLIPLRLAENCIPRGAKSQGCDFEFGKAWMAHPNDPAKE